MEDYVLVVDDHPDVRQLIVDVLGTMKVPAKEAINGQEALVMLQEHQPSAIVLDIMMPVMNGFTFITKIYADKPGRAIPVILLSGVADDSQMKKLPGVVGVLRKGGFKIDELRDMLKKALDKDGPATEPLPAIQPIESNGQP